MRDAPGRYGRSGSADSAAYPHPSHDQGHLAKANTVCKLGQTFAGYDQEMRWSKTSPKKKAMSRQVRRLEMDECVQARRRAVEAPASSGFGKVIRKEAALS